MASTAYGRLGAGRYSRWEQSAWCCGMGSVRYRAFRRRILLLPSTMFGEAPRTVCLLSAAKARSCYGTEANGTASSAQHGRACGVRGAERLAMSLPLDPLAR